MGPPAQPTLLPAEPRPEPKHAPGTIVRRLAGVERLVALGNARYRACFGVIAALEIEGPFTRALLERALGAMQRQHGSLRVTVEEDPEEPNQWVFRESRRPLELEVVERTHAERWRETWNELSHGVIVGLPVRVVWVRAAGDERSHLVAAFHHAMSDGRSVALFFDGLLRAVRRAHDGTSESEWSLPIPPPVHELVRARWPVAALARIGFQRLFGNLHTVPFDHDAVVPLAERRWHGHFRAVDEPQVARLRERCREEGVTVGNAFGAAMAIELADRVVARGRPSRRFRVAMCTSVDLRPHIDPPIDPRTMGLIAAAVHSFHEPKRGAGLWDVARAERRQLERAMDNREHRDMTQLTRLLGPAAVAQLERANRGRPNDCALLISNCGQLGDMEYPPFRAHGLFFTGAQAAWGTTLTLCLSTVRGRMSLHLGHPWPLVSDETGAGFIDGVLGRLGHATS